MTEFLFKMSHELRTPLNAILGFAHIALREIDDNEKVKEYLNHIIDSAEELLNIENNNKSYINRTNLDEKLYNNKFNIDLL